MKRLLITTIVVSLFYASQSQNTGIGITTPRATLHVFSGASGNLTPHSPMVVESNSATYINLLSPDAAETGLLFGQASNAASGGIVYNNSSTSNGFQFRTNGNITRMVIRANGDVGIGIVAPGATLDVFRGTNDGGTAIFRGTQHISHFNHSIAEHTYIRGCKNNSFVVLSDIPGGRVGIGTNNPNAPLGFPAATGKKITLYPGASGDVGFAVQGNLLQIYSDLPNADIAFGYDQSGVFTERFRMKGNGAFSVNGNTGTPGQVLQTNGDAGPTWSNSTNLLYSNTIELPASTQIELTSSTSVAIPGLSHSFTTNSNTKVLITFSIYTSAGACFNCGTSDCFIDINLNGVVAKRYVEDIQNGTTHSFAGSALLQVGPGTHTISFTAFKFGPNMYIGHPSQASQVILQIIPQ
jgi:hypothetical protein